MIYCYTKEKGAVWYIMKTVQDLRFIHAQPVIAMIALILGVLVFVVVMNVVRKEIIRENPNMSDSEFTPVGFSVFAGSVATAGVAVLFLMFGFVTPSHVTASMASTMVKVSDNFKLQPQMMDAQVKAINHDSGETKVVKLNHLKTTLDHKHNVKPGDLVTVSYQQKFGKVIGFNVSGLDSTKPVKLHVEKVQRVDNHEANHLKTVYQAK